MKFTSNVVLTALLFSYCLKSMAVTLECDIPKNGSNAVSMHFVEDISTENGWKISEHSFTKSYVQNVNRDYDDRRQITILITNKPQSILITGTA